MIDRQAVETQGQSSRYDAPTLEELRAEKTEQQAWQALQLEHEEAEQTARDAILDPIRARLAAGTVSAIRLQNITGLDEQKFGALMKGWSLSGWGSCSCCVPCDHIPLRSWPLVRAREVMRGLIETLKAKQAT